MVLPATQRKKRSQGFTLAESSHRSGIATALVLLCILVLVLFPIDSSTFIQVLPEATFISEDPKKSEVESVPGRTDAQQQEEEETVENPTADDFETNSNLQEQNVDPANAESEMLIDIASSSESSCETDGKMAPSSNSCSSFDSLTWKTVKQDKRIESTSNSTEPFSENQHNFCYTSKDSGVCVGTLPHTEAEQYCRSIGARLCTLSEVQTALHVTVGQPSTACNAKPASVWTATRCRLEKGATGMMTASTRYTLKPTDWWPYETCVPEHAIAHRMAIAMCCADDQGREAQKCTEVLAPSLRRRETKLESEKEWKAKCDNSVSAITCAMGMSGRYNDFPFPSLDEIRTWYKSLSEGEDCHWNKRCNEWTTGAGRWVPVQMFTDGSFKDKAYSFGQSLEHDEMLAREWAKRVPKDVDLIDNTAQTEMGKSNENVNEATIEQTRSETLGFDDSTTNTQDEGEMSVFQLQMMGESKRRRLLEHDNDSEKVEHQFDGEQPVSQESSEGGNQGELNSKPQKIQPTWSDSALELLEYHPQKCWWYRFRDSADIESCFSDSTEIVFVGNSALYRAFTCLRKRLGSSSATNVDCETDIQIPAGTAPDAPVSSFVLRNGRRALFYAVPADQIVATNLLVSWKEGCDSLRNDPELGVSVVCPTLIVANEWSGVSLTEFQRAQVVKPASQKIDLLANQSLFHRRFLNQAAALRQSKRSVPKKNVQPSVSVYWVTTALGESDGTERMIGTATEYNSFLKDNVIRTPASLVDWFDMSITYPRPLSNQGSEKTGLFDSLITALLNRVYDKTIRSGMVRSKGQLCKSKRCTTCSQRGGVIPAQRASPSLLSWLRQHSSPVVFPGFLNSRWNLTWDHVYNITEARGITIPRPKRKIKLHTYLKKVVLQTKKVMPEQSVIYGGDTKLPIKLRKLLNLYVPRDLATSGFQQRVGLWLGATNVGVPLHRDKVNAGHLLFQYLGRERITLLPPTVTSLSYLRLNKERGDMQSAVGYPVDVDIQQFPMFAGALASMSQVELNPGDLMFIPNGWIFSALPQEPSLLVSYWLKSQKGV